MQYVPKFVREAIKAAGAVGAGLSYLAGHSTLNPAYATPNGASAQTAPENRGYFFAVQKQSKHTPDAAGNIVVMPKTPTTPQAPDSDNGKVIEFGSGEISVERHYTPRPAEPIQEIVVTPLNQAPWYRNKWTYGIGAAAIAVVALASIAYAAFGNKSNNVTPPATPVSATYTPVPVIVPPVETVPATPTPAATETYTPVPVIVPATATPTPVEDPLLASLPTNLRNYFTNGGPSGIDTAHRAALATYMAQLNESSPDEATKFSAFYAKNPQLVESIKPEYLPFMTRLAEAEPLFTQDGDSVTPDGLKKTMIDITTPMGRVGSPIDNLTETELQQYIRLVAENAAARGRDIPDDPLDASLGFYDISKHSCTYAGGCGFTWETVKKNLSALPAATEANKAYLKNPQLLYSGQFSTPVEYVKGRARGTSPAFSSDGNQLQKDIDILWNNGSPDIKDVISILGKSYDENLDHPDFASYLDDIYSKSLGLPVHVVDWEYPNNPDVWHSSIGINPDEYSRDKDLLEQSSNKKLLLIGSLEMGLREPDALAAGVPEMLTDYGIYWTLPKNNQ